MVKHGIMCWYHGRSLLPMLISPAGLGSFVCPEYLFVTQPRGHARLLGSRPWALPRLGPRHDSCLSSMIGFWRPLQVIGRTVFSVAVFNLAMQHNDEVLPGLVCRCMRSPGPAGLLQQGTAHSGAKGKEKKRARHLACTKLIPVVPEFAVLG
jgi:hypothetical protein